ESVLSTVLFTGTAPRSFMTFPIQLFFIPTFNSYPVEMGTDLFKKYVTICFRSVVRHPFLVGMILFLFSMYRLFPLLFSAVISASPVIVSTAVLLGTLLSFGQPNLPEIEKEPESGRVEVRKLESEVVGHTEIVGRDGSIEVVDKLFEGMSRVNGDDLVDD
ncbi:hypothetical protein M8C21_027978, partial [Ambrosia artemisiifolia]